VLRRVWGILSVHEGMDVTLTSLGMTRRRVDFVGVDVFFGERLVNGLVEAGEQLGQGLAPPPGGVPAWPGCSV
jgi:hypothetical protein